MSSLPKTVTAENLAGAGASTEDIKHDQLYEDNSVEKRSRSLIESVDNKKSAVQVEVTVPAQVSAPEIEVAEAASALEETPYEYDPEDYYEEEVDGGD